MDPNYQVLNSQDSPVYGNPRYDGLEYDYEVPNQMVVESPGGTSSTHHHWTKGFYGTGGSSSDVFGNEPPATVYGNTGSLYASGPTASQVWAPGAPGPGGYYGQPPVGTAPNFLGNQPPPNPPPEPFITNDNIEHLAAGRANPPIPYPPIPPPLTPKREKYIPSAGETNVEDFFSNSSRTLQLTGKTTILIMVTVFVAFFWAHLGLSFLQHRYSGAVPLEILGVYTLVLTCILIGFIWKFGI